jgi:hypothetical protein
MRTAKEILREYKELLEKIPEMIDKAGYKDKFIFESLGINKGSFYRKLKKPESWTFEELEKLFEIIERN